MAYSLMNKPFLIKTATIRFIMVIFSILNLPHIENQQR